MDATGFVAQEKVQGKDWVWWCWGHGRDGFCFWVDTVHELHVRMMRSRYNVADVSGVDLMDAVGAGSLCVERQGRFDGVWHMEKGHFRTEWNQQWISSNCQVIVELTLWSSHRFPLSQRPTALMIRLMKCSDLNSLVLFFSVTFPFCSLLL